MNEARQDHTATLLLNGKVLVAGGRGIVGYPGNLASAELFDPVTDTWTVTGSMNQVRRRHTATLVSDGRVLVAGGFFGTNETTPSAELYDPESGTWTAIASMNSDRAIHWATLMLDGRILVVGGYQYTGTGGGYLRSSEIYDPQAASWQPSGDRGVYMIGSGFALLPSGDVLAAAGYGNAFGVNYPTNSEIYSAATGSWSNTSPCIESRQDGLMTMLADGRVLFLGGRLGTQVHSSCEIFTSTLPPTPPTSTIMALPTGRIQITLTNRPGALFQVLCNPDPGKPIDQWWINGVTIEMLPGKFQFTDKVPLDSRRFYRLLSIP